MNLNEFQRSTIWRNLNWIACKTGQNTNSCHKCAHLRVQNAVSPTNFSGGII